MSLAIALACPCSPINCPPVSTDRPRRAHSIQPCDLERTARLANLTFGSGVRLLPQMTISIVRTTTHRAILQAGPQRCSTLVALRVRRAGQIVQLLLDLIRCVPERSNRPRQFARTSRRRGCSCPVPRSNSTRINAVRRNNGSASASRLVLWSSTAKLLSCVATSGWSGPYVASLIARARRYSGSASTSRLVALSSAPGC